MVSNHLDLLGLILTVRQTKGQVDGCHQTSTTYAQHELKAQKLTQEMARQCYLELASGNPGIPTH